VEGLSHPPLSFLVFVPLRLLGIADPNVTTLVFFLAVILFLFREAPPKIRLLPVIVMFIDPNQLLFTLGGVFDIVWVFFMLLSIKLFYNGKILTSAILLGIASSVKLTPALAAPFIMIWIFKERGLKEALKFLMVTLASFAAISAPFFIWDPVSYVNSISMPLIAIPHGHGIAAITYYGFIPLSPEFFRLSVGVVFAVTTILYYLNFPKLKQLCWISPSILLWFHYRSLQNYFIFFVPIVFFLLILEAKSRGILNER